MLAHSIAYPNTNSTNPHPTYNTHSPWFGCAYCGAVIQSSQHPVTMLLELLPITPKQGYRYSDGRIICCDCYAHAVKSSEQLSTIWQQVNTQLQQLGLYIQWNALPIQLYKKQDMQVSLAHTPHANAGAVLGYTQVVQGKGRITPRVGILYGIPTALAVLTLAHEAGHVWCHQQHIAFTPDAKQEEGFCNLVSLEVLKALPPLYLKDTLIEHLFACTNTMYGDKFREEWAKMEQVGWEQYLQQLRTQYTVTTHS